MSSNAGVFSNTKTIIESGKRAVVGTTGLTEAQFLRLFLRYPFDHHFRFTKYKIQEFRAARGATQETTKTTNYKV